MTSRESIRDTLANLFLRAIALTGLSVGSFPVKASTRIPPGGNAATHNMGGPHTTAVTHTDALWAAEGEHPCFEAPHRLTELQVWHRGKLHRFHGDEAAKRLSVIAPTFFAQLQKERRGPVGRFSLGHTLALYTTGQSMARSYIGGTFGGGNVMQTADYIVSGNFVVPSKVAGIAKNRRFYHCVIKTFGALRLLQQKFQNPIFGKLARLLTSNMLQEGRCETKLVKILQDALPCVLFGEPHNALEELILQLSEEERVALWRFRRILQKDDNDPVANAEAAMQRMCEPVVDTEEDRSTARQVLDLWEEHAGRYVAGHLEELKNKHDRTALHRASATLWHPRKTGGGSAEMHLIVAMYRLSKGEATPLSDVWGEIPEDVDIEELTRDLTTHEARRKEVLEACEWFLIEAERRGVSYPFLCIYPEREPKSRTFLLLHYALQQAGMQAASVVSDYLRFRTDTREVYTGFDTASLLARVRRDIDAGAEMVLSLDSKVSTDPLRHDYCLRVYRPFYPAFSSFTKRGLEMIFAPMKVHIATGRPPSIVGRMAWQNCIGENIGLRLTFTDVPRPEEKLNGNKVFVKRKSGVPSFLRTYAMYDEIANALKLHGRVILKSPTGSGKSVLAASGFNSIIQFPSTAALEIFSESLKALGIPHNIWYSRKKELQQMCALTGEPRSILCTAFYVPQLSEQYPNMVVVLDEAETPMETYLWNIFWTRKQGRTTLLMSATPDEILGEGSTVRLELPGGTNYPIVENACDFDEMMELLSQRNYPKSLVCAFSEPLCQKIANTLTSKGRKAVALTARERQTDYADRLAQADVIVSTNVIRSSVTLPGLLEVFDLGLVYSGVDFPVSGFESLVLFQVSQAMWEQVKGRVGRLGPGTAWKVNYPKANPEPYSTRILFRTPLIASKLGKIPLNVYSRPLNVGSIVVERASQELARLGGVRMESFRPLWCTIIRRKASSARISLLAVVSFEALGMANRMQQLRDEEDMQEPYGVFRTMTAVNYFSSVKAILLRCHEQNWFVNELAQINRWTEDMEEEDGEELLTLENYQAMALALWRQVARFTRNELVGTFRNFHVAVPTGVERREGQYAIVVGLTQRMGAVSAKSVIHLPQEIVDELRELISQIPALSCEVEEEEIPILSTQTSLLNDESQSRQVSLRWDAYARHHVFQPEALDELWEGLLKAIKRFKKTGSDNVTTRGSPMSSTASFPVLNGLGVAAHDFARRETGETASSASIFGDDDFAVGSERFCREDQRAREAVGLQTKESATGRIRIRDESGNLLPEDANFAVNKAFALFTERALDARGRYEIPSIKPAGMLRLYEAYHDGDLMLAGTSYASDMESYRRQVERLDRSWIDVLVANGSPIHQEEARRTTAPRRIITRSLRDHLGPMDTVALGSDVNDLFDHLEQVLLLFYPSTKGKAARVEEPYPQTLGHPVMGYAQAIRMAKALQGEDCYFKLHRPPLRFREGRRAIEVASHELTLRGIFPDRHLTMQAAGWGQAFKLPDSVPENSKLHWLDAYDEIEPVSYGEILFESA